MHLIIIGSNTQSIGGIQRYITEQVDYLPDCIDVTIHDTESPEGSGPIWFMKAFIDAVIDALRFPFLSSPDVVHIHTAHRLSFYRSAYYVLFCSYIQRCPVLLHIHGSDFDEFVSTDSILSQFIQNRTYSAADELIVLSKYWKTILEEEIPEDKITILPNAVDPTLFSPTFDPDPSHVVFISHLIRRKGIGELVEVLDNILTETDETFQVSIAGKGPLANLAENLSEQHANVTYFGYVSEEEKRRLLNEGSIYILPTYAEGMPIAILEAMAGGNAIISTTVGSIPEVIDNENGILINPGDIQQLELGLRRLLDEPESVEEMARNNREQVEEKYSWSKTIEQLVKHYQELLRNNHS